MTTRRALVTGAALAPAPVYCRVGAEEHISLSEPVLVVQSPPEEARWERYQSPILERYTAHPLFTVTAEMLHADSCGYTRLLALDDHSFLIAYSHFSHRVRTESCTRRFWCAG